MKFILGLHVGHEAAAALIVDGRIVVDAAEERFTRVKNDSSFPLNALAFCLSFVGITSEDLDAIALPSEFVHAPVQVFMDIPKRQLPKENRPIRSTLKQTALSYVLNSKRGETTLPLYQKPLSISPDCKIILIGHHRSHAGSAYYTSGLNHERVLVVSMDGRGDSDSVVVWKGENNRLERLAFFGAEASLGWFYSNCTEALGWRHGCDEWKTMGLAPYGHVQPGSLDGFYPVFKSGKLVQPHTYVNGGTWLDHSSYHYHFDDAYYLEGKMQELGRENFAAEAQRVFQEQVNEIVLPWAEKLHTRHLCAAGGAFLNVKANQDLWYSGKFDTQWIYPNPGDAGLAAGSALCAYYDSLPEHRHERLRNIYFGPEFTNDEIKQILEERGLDYEYVDNPSRVAAKLLADNNIIGWFQGRMEAGPRALGNRSILMSPLKSENKDIINRCVKYREGFRPFCPSILSEESSNYLIAGRDEWFMVTSFAVREEKRDKIPAVVHVDGTARPQLVEKESNPRFHALIKAFGDITGEYVVLNTSFNVKGEPIVCHPREAIRCFYDTGLHALILGNYKIQKPRRTRV